MAEGAPLLREYTLTGIEGSNPSLTAKQKTPVPKRSGVFYLAVTGEFDGTSPVRQIAMDS